MNEKQIEDTREHVARIISDEILHAVMVDNPDLIAKHLANAEAARHFYKEFFGWEREAKARYVRSVEEEIASRRLSLEQANEPPRDDRPIFVIAVDTDAVSAGVTLELRDPTFHFDGDAICAYFRIQRGTGKNKDLTGVALPLSQVRPVNEHARKLAAHFAPSPR